MRRHLEQVGLSGLAGRWPRELSGGMRKRVDLARAYAANPDVLLLDEPFGSLDVLTKEEMQIVFARTWRDEGRTAIFVTHDVEEAIFVADRVAVMTIRPGTIKAVVEIPFGQRRESSVRLTPEFLELRRWITAELSSAREQIAMRKKEQDGALSPSRWISALTVLAFVALWIFLTSKPGPDFMFPRPASIAQAIKSLGFGLASDASVTLVRVLVGWCAGVLLGTQAGLWMTRNRIFYAVANPLVEALRPVPPVALIPFFILWFGLGWGGQILLIGLGCFMVMAVNTYSAVHNVPPIYVRAAASLGAPTGAIYKTVIQPAILPSLVSGYRISAALAFAWGSRPNSLALSPGLGY